MVDDQALLVSCSVKNTGDVPGREVSQLYLSFPSIAGEPPWQLRGVFKTQLLHPGQHQGIAFDLDERDFMIWSENIHDWTAVRGKFNLRIGTSSRNWRLEASISRDTPSVFIRSTT